MFFNVTNVSHPPKSKGTIISTCFNIFLLLEVIHINRIQPRHLQFADEDLTTVQLNLNDSKGHNKSKSCTKT